MTEEDRRDMWEELGEIESRWMGLQYMKDAEKSTLTDEEKRAVDEEIAALQVHANKLRSMM